MLATQTKTLHVRYAGRSTDMDLATLGVKPDVQDEDLISALATHLDREVIDFADYVVVREPEAVIVRPLAIYG